MWIKINTRNSTKKVVFLPHALVNLTGTQQNIHFGNKKALAQIKYHNNYEPQSGFSPENPFSIIISSALQKKLLIPDAPIYRLKIEKNKFIIGPVVGFLLGNYRYSPRHMKKYNDRFGIYQQLGGLFLAFSSKGINFEKETLTGFYYQPSKNTWLFEKFPFPSFIYRRNFNTTPPQLINKLKQITKNQVTNSYNHSKYELHQLLTKNNFFENHLPPTEKVTNFKQIKKFIQKHEKTILKPVNSSRGRGIIIINKKINKQSEKKYTLSIYNRTADVSPKRLFKILKKNNVFANNYLIQKYLDLATINNSVFDLRVVMQKIKSEKWFCTGIEVRKAASEKLLTNISRGGTAVSFSKMLNEKYSTRQQKEEIKQKIYNLGFNFCYLLDDTEEHYHEFGLDLALDKNNKIWFIEANILPSFNGFKTINKQNYYFLKYNPLRYAVSRCGFPIDNGNSLYY